MKSFIAVVVLLVGVSCILLWRVLSHDHAPRRSAPIPQDADESRSSTIRRPSLMPLLEEVDASGQHYALMTRSSRRGIYGRVGGNAPELLDAGVAVGASLDLAVTDGRIHAAYVDAPSGEVRVAIQGRTPRAWIGLKRLEDPGPIVLTAGQEGVLVSYYDRAVETLYYTYYERDTSSWRHGVASSGGGYRVVTGRPGALVLRN